MRGDRRAKSGGGQGADLDVKRLPKDLRPRLFASIELMLDMLHSIRSRAPSLDLESLFICTVVNEAAMRKLLVGPHARPDLIDHPFPPDDARGSISRLLIADRVGLPRETVRRKVNQLIEAGILCETNDGEVRPVILLNDAIFQDIAEEWFSAAQRFDARLRSLSCAGIGESQPGENEPMPAGARRGEIS